MCKIFLSVCIEYGEYGRIRRTIKKMNIYKFHYIYVTYYELCNLYNFLFGL